MYKVFDYRSAQLCTFVAFFWFNAFKCKESELSVSRHSQLAPAAVGAHELLTSQCTNCADRQPSTLTLCIVGVLWPLCVVRALCCVLLWHTGSGCPQKCARASSSCRTGRRRPYERSSESGNGADRSRRPLCRRPNARRRVSVSRTALRASLEVWAASDRRPAAPSWSARALQKRRASHSRPAPSTWE